MSAHPPPPWLLSGRFLFLPAAFDSSPHGRRHGVPAARLPLGGLLLARYDRASTLSYSELLLVDGVARAGSGLAAHVGVALVDSPASVSGGRSIWSIPKRLAEFSWKESGPALRAELVVVEEGVKVLRARVSGLRRELRVPLPVAGRFAGCDPARAAWARGRLWVSPARVCVHIPPDTPLAARLPRFSAVGLLGHARLRVAGPHVSTRESAAT